MGGVEQLQPEQAQHNLHHRSSRRVSGRAGSTTMTTTAASCTRTAITTALAAAVVEGVQQPVVEAFHLTMRNVIIPAYEAGTRQMIAQTSTVLSQGMANMAAEQTRALQELRPSGPDEATLRTMQNMAAQMEKLATQVDSLKAEVARLSSTMPRQGGGPPGMAPP